MRRSSWNGPFPLIAIPWTAVRITHAGRPPVVADPCTGIYYNPHTEYIAEQLREMGAEVSDVIAYRTILEEGQGPDDPDVYGMLLQNGIDVVTFTSPSAVRNFAKVYGAEQSADLLRNTVVASIGPSTSEAAAQLGITVSVQPAVSTIPALVDALAAHFAAAPAATI